jgi:hypothetical protein
VPNSAGSPGDRTPRARPDAGGVRPAFDLPAPGKRSGGDDTRTLRVVSFWLTARTVGVGVASSRELGTGGRVDA